MIRSMTGYGRARFAVADAAFEVEIRTVNHRYLDARVKLPRPLAAFEGAVKTRIQGRLGRGKVDMSVSMGAGESGGPRVEIDRGAAEQYLAAAGELAKGGVAGALDVSTLLSLPGVSRFVEPELPEAQLEKALGGAVDEALSRVDEMRAAEGKALDEDLRGRLERVAELGSRLGGRSGVVQEAVREKLRKRTAQLQQETGVIDEGRLHHEIVIAADRLDITEETVRLSSHVDQFRSVLAEAGPGSPVGRRLDFLLQEMGREANTIGSKGNDAPIAHDVVELKTELERIREQVQNVE